MKKPNTAIVTGSFDPITVGHIDIIERADTLFERVIVAVLDNTAKHTMFSAEQRLFSVRSCFMNRAGVEVVLENGLLADFAAATENAVIVRGARNTMDFEYEKTLFEINKSLCGVDTVVLPAKKEYEFISSSFVKELIKYGKDTSEYIPKAAADILFGGEKLERDS